MDSYPKKENEIMLSEDALSQLGIKKMCIRDSPCSRQGYCQYILSGTSFTLLTTVIVSFRVCLCSFTAFPA